MIERTIVVDNERFVGRGEELRRFGREDELCWGHVKLELMVSHQEGEVEETVWEGCMETNLW